MIRRRIVISSVGFIAVVIGVCAIEWRINRTTSIPGCVRPINRVILDEEIGLYRVEEVFQVDSADAIRSFCENAGMGTNEYAPREATFSYRRGRQGFPTAKADEISVYQLDSPVKLKTFKDDSSKLKFGLSPKIGDVYVYHYGMSGHWLRILAIGIMKKFS
jgi:hypothetical protein